MKLKLVAAMVVAGALPFSVHAADNSGKAYVFGTAGMAKYAADDLNDYYANEAATYNSYPGVSASTDDEDTDASFTVGAGYQFNKFLAAEVFYRSYGEITAGVHATNNVDDVNETDTLKASGLGVGLVGFLPVTDALNFYLRLDAVNLKVEAAYHYDDTFGNPTEDYAYEDTKVKVGIGAGAQYNFEGGFSLRADVERIEGEIEFDDGSSTKGDIDTISIGVLKAF